MTDVNPNRWGANEQLKDILGLKGIVIVRPQTLPHQRVGWRLKGKEVRELDIAI